MFILVNVLVEYNKEKLGFLDYYSFLQKFLYHISKREIDNSLGVMHICIMKCTCVKITMA